MAETYIALTKPETIDENWPPKIAEPVISGMTSYFPHAATNPVANSQEVAVMRGHAHAIPGQVVSNEGARLAPSGAPVNNDHGAATIHREATPNGFATPMEPIQQSSDVSMHPGGQPMRNDGAAIIHHISAPLHVPEERKLPPGTVISNENNVSFAPSAAPPQTAIIPPPSTPSPERHIAKPVDAARDSYAPMNVNGDVFMPPAQNPQPVQHTVNNEGAQFYATGKPMYADTDHTFGASGESNKVAGRDDVTFGGAGGTMSVGSTDITQAASGDTTKAAGTADTIMTETKGMLGNHETQTGATGDPTSNSSFVGVQTGATGKPIQRNRS